MRIPIAYALAWPERIDDAGAAARPRGDRAGSTSKRPTSTRFPALRLAREALEAGGAAPIVLNAANEVAVASFLAGRIRFPDIARAWSSERSAEANCGAPRSIDDVLEIDRATRDARRGHDEGELRTDASATAPLADPDRVRLRARPARLLPRARPLSRRAAVRHPRRDLFDRLRPRDRRLDRPAGNALESRLAAARRLCEVRRRHEPGEQSRRRRAASRRASRPGVPAAAGVAALPGRACRAGGQFPAGDPDLRRFLRDRRRRRRRQRRRDGPARHARPSARACRPGDRIVSIAGRETPTFDDIRSDRRASSGRDRRRSRSSAAASADSTSSSRSGRESNATASDRSYAHRPARHLRQPRS